MSGKNDELQGMSVALAFVGVGAIVVGIFLFAVFAFLAFILTIAALIAWNEPLHIGKHTVEPAEARAFITRGVAGAFLIPAFAVFSSVLLGFAIEDAAWPYLIIGGYVAGSVGVGILLADEDGEITTATDVTPPQSIAPPEEPASPPVPFRFASWDDEEQR